MAQRQFRSDDTDKWTYKYGLGTDGNLVISGNTTDAPIDSSCSGAAGNNTLSATNASFAAGQFILIHQTRGAGVGNWELNKIAGYVAGTITLAHNLINTYTDSGASQAQVLVMKQYNDVTVNNGVTLTAKAWDGNVGGIIAFFAKGAVNIAGNILLSGKGFRGGAGRVTTSENAGATQGEGTDGAGANSAGAANGNGGGPGWRNTGYGSNYNKGGAGGGNGVAAINVCSPVVYGGAAVGNAALTLMDFGGGGGGGQGPNNPPGAGGIGGGICLIVGKSITISGTLYTKGSNGGNGTGDGNGGGGGAGGSVLLKANEAVLGSGLILASGGSGGTGPDPSGGGAVGRIHLDYGKLYSGVTTPTLDVSQDAILKDAVGGAMLFPFIHN